MKKPLFAALSLALAVSAHAQSQDPKPTWELGKNVIDPASIQGKIELVDGVVTLGGQNERIVKYNGIVDTVMKNEGIPEGAFLVSAECEHHTVTFVSIVSETGGTARVENPWETNPVTITRSAGKQDLASGETIEIAMSKGDKVRLVENRRNTAT